MPLVSHCRYLSLEVIVLLETGNKFLFTGKNGFWIKTNCTWTQFNHGRILKSIPLLDSTILLRVGVSSNEYRCLCSANMLCNCNSNENIEKEVCFIFNFRSNINLLYTSNVQSDKISYSGTGKEITTSGRVDRILSFIRYLLQTTHKHNSTESCSHSKGREQ